jgi:hypothetical protein
VGPAVRAIGRVLVHETLAVFATDLCDLLLLLRHLTLWRHAVSRHGLTVAWIHGLAICGIGIVSLVVARRTISLLDRIASGHVSLLRHTACGYERYLCATCKVGTTLDLHNGLETILDCGSSSSCAAWRHSNAKWKGLSRTLAEVRRSSHLDISGEENIFDPMHFLDPLIVGKRHPNRFLVGLEHSCFHRDSFTLNVFVSFNVDLSYDRLSFREGRLVESYPDFTLWRD